MKITKRNLHTSPMSTAPIWIIPTMSYLLQKMGGMQFNEYEYVWWVGVPTMFTIWFMLNFKITK